MSKTIVKKVAGSTGVHTVRRENDTWTCTCMGFTCHKKDCIHIIDEKNLIKEFGEPDL